MSLLWTATGSKGAASLQGNTDVEWFRIQSIRPASVCVVDNPDPLRGPEKMFRFEVRYGDNYPGMSDSRCLVTGPAKLWVDRGTEQWWRWWTLQPEDWIGLYPKWDQQSDWPAVGSSGGSGLEFHHEPFGGGVERGSAPLYTGASDTSLWLHLVDPATGAVRNAFDLVPLERARCYEWVLHVLWDWDPVKGFLELWIDGANVLPKLQTATMFPNTRIYPVAGIYRNFNIGGQIDQNGNPLVWTVGAKAGASYPHGFVPAPGQLVYPDAGGYPGAQCLGGFAAGSSRDDVMNAYPVRSATSPGGSVPSQPMVVPPKAQDGLALLIAERPILDAQIAALDESIAKLSQTRAALAQLRTSTTALLDRGPWDQP